jgi:hypothetical protein
MGALFSRPKTPAPPPPPPNPMVSADSKSSITGPGGNVSNAGGTALTGPGGAPEIKTTGKTLLGQ